MPKKNAYLARQEEKMTRLYELTLNWTAQLSLDCICMVLNDPEVMGKDVFGKERLHKVCVAFEKRFKEAHVGLTNKPEASHVRAMVDREMKRIGKEAFIPWEERYEDWDDRGI